MRWDLAERTEDAVVSYLAATVDGSIRCVAAWDQDAMQYPCAVVHAASEAPVSDDAEWHDARAIEVQVAVMTEGAEEIDGNARLVKKARERNADARSEVMNALAISGLNAALVLQGVEEIAFSMAQVTNVQRSVENERYLVSMITVLVIAEPVTGS